MKMFLNCAMTCRASMSWRQSSPTLKMALCHTSTCGGSSGFVRSATARRTLNVAMNGVLAADWSGRPDVRLMSTTAPSGLDGRYTPSSTAILAISSSILAFFSGLEHLTYGRSEPEMPVTFLKKANSRS